MPSFVFVTLQQRLSLLMQAAKYFQEWESPTKPTQQPTVSGSNMPLVVNQPVPYTAPTTVSNALDLFISLWTDSERLLAGESQC
jgi:hypothetical protein